MFIFNEKVQERSENFYRFLASYLIINNEMQIRQTKFNLWTFIPRFCKSYAVSTKLFFRFAVS